MTPRFLVCLFLALATAKAFGADSPGLQNTTILIIRHAEKPASGNTLTPAGEKRAQAYIQYFQNFTVDSQPFKIDTLIAAANSEGSHRPFLTIEPLSKALGMPIDQRFNAKEFQKLADDLRAKPHGQHILICWHHGDIPQLTQALGVDTKELFKNDKWPDDVFCWVIQLRYDANGRLIDAKRVNEDLMSGDTDHDK
jgi:hypothetical protein